MNYPYSPRTDVQLSDPVLSQLSSIASQSALGVELLSPTLDSTPTESPSADSQKEPISIGITDASITTENVSFILDTFGEFFFSFLIHLVFSSFIQFLAMSDTSRGNTYARAGV